MGGLDPEFGDRAIAAVKAFQKRNKFDETGILTPEQRQTLGGAMRTRKEYNGWRIVEDTVTPGVRLGIPAKLVPQTEIGTTGSRWTAARGEIQIETFREKMAGSQLSELFEEMKKRPSGRRTEASALQASTFSLSGMQGLKKFHVRAYLKDNEARGITILFDQAMEGIMLPMVDTITNSFLPFGDPNSAVDLAQGGIRIGHRGDAIGPCRHRTPAHRQLPGHRRCGPRPRRPARRRQGDRPCAAARLWRGLR